MSKFHSTVSRRDFMKGLGLAGAGLGAAAAAAPVLHDLDEVIASPGNVQHYPWWVKDREFNDPTTEIDWSLMQRKDMRDTTFNARGKGYWADFIGQDVETARQATKTERVAQGIRTSKPGYSLRNESLGSSISYSARTSDNCFLGNEFTVKTPERYGVARWEGTPEENSKMLRAAAKANGAAEVAFVELNAQTSQNIVYANDFQDGKAYVFGDVDQPKETDTTRTIPNKARWLINFALLESLEIYGRGISGGGLRYSMGRQSQRRIQAFLIGIGYLAMGPYSYINNMTHNVMASVLGGLGEQGRHNMVISPNFGSVLGVACSIITDLPLAPTPPIDAGIRRFCHTCKKCAELCPGNALSLETDPYWEVKGPWNRSGYKHWFFLGGACFPFNDLCGHWGCGTRCTFAKGDAGFVHTITKAVMANTPLFNGFFRQMDDVWGYGTWEEELRDPEGFWDLELPPFGYTNTRGMRPKPNV